MKPSAVLLTTVLAVVPACALAVPGQTIAQLKAESSKNVMLRWFVPRRFELSGLPMLTLDGGDHGIAWHIVAMTDGVRVTKEYVTIETRVKEAAGGDAIGRGTGYPFTILAALYRGSSVAADWKSAKPIASIIDPTNKVTTRYYLGHLFGFSVTGGRGLTVYTKQQFKRDLALARKLAKKCAADPAFCASDE